MKLKRVCKHCGKEFSIWPSQIRLGQGHYCSYSCNSSAEHKTGSRNSQWKGGKFTNPGGYIVSNLDNFNREDRQYITAHKNYCLEHWAVMAISLRRKLLSTEIVHHINGIRSDNRLENLTILNKEDHPTRTFIPILQERIQELETIISILKTLTPVESVPPSQSHRVSPEKSSIEHPLNPSLNLKTEKMELN